MNQNLGRGTLLVAYFILAVAAAIALFPLSLMVISSLKKSTEIVANPLALPSSLQWANFARAWTDAQLGRSLLNSAETTGFAVILICSTCSLAAYALARRTGPRLRWVGAYFLATTTLPIQLYLFPLYFGFAHLGLIDNVFALSFIYTAVYSPFAIFLLRTYFLAIPRELEEAAVIDGASRWDPDRCPDFRPQHLERIPDLFHVSTKPRPTNRRRAVLHPGRAIQQ
jgi:raffinose/stachyose/melibiose transport system permease protein